MAGFRPTTPTAGILLAVGSLMWLCGLPPTEAMLTCSSCERGSSLKLTCPDSFSNQFTVSLYPYNSVLKGSLHLKCDYVTKNINLTMLEGCSFPEVIHVKIDQCPLFEESLESVLSKIGVTAVNVRSLLWIDSHSVGKGLQAWHLENMPNLTLVQFQGNEFTSCPTEFLKKTPLVQELFFTGNYLTELPIDILAYTPGLIVVDFGNNDLESLPDNLLEKVPSLQMLNLWNNKLTSVPTNLTNNSQQLTKINLSGNQLVSITPQLFSNLTNLTIVTLRGNRLETLPESVFEGCINLLTLSLQHNQLTYLPPKLFQGTSLQVLNLGFNKLTNITGTLNDLKTLQNVTLHKNAFETLDAGMFTGSNNIVHLDFQFNEIRTLSFGIFQSLSKLRLIMLNNNLLNQLPPALFQNCIALVRIFLQKNNLTTIPSDTFPAYSDIVKLDISSNRLTFENIYFNPLNKLTHIEHLNLANNKISAIFDDALHIFTLLRFLDLRNNSISSLTGRDLLFISKNVTLLLQDNNISNITTQEYFWIGTNTKKYTYVSLAGNPLNCDCKMYHFLTSAHLSNGPNDMKQLYNLIVEDASQALCSEPENYFNTSLADVDPTKVICEYDCSEECICSLRIHDRLVFMDCSNLGLSEPPKLFDKFMKLVRKLNKSLDLSNNDYEDVSFLANVEYERLINLDLTNNSLSELNASFIPDSLKYMDLRFNNFTSMSSSLVAHLNSSGMELRLGENPWSCDCGLKSFHEFFRNNYELVLDRQRVVCSDGQAPVLEITTEQLCPFFYQPATLASITAGAVLMLLVAVLVTAAWYRHKEMVKVWLYSKNMCLWAVTEHEMDADKKYDAFISYSYKDERFVNNILVPGLESGDPKYKVCLHYRDWIPGEYIQDQILSSVRASRRTIVVLSKNFIESVWGQLEFKAAHSQALKDKTNRIIIIVYGDVPSQDELDGELKLYVSINTYLKWGDQKFWERLRYAMPHSKYTHYKKSKVDKLELVKPAPHVDVTANKALDD